MPMGGEPEVDFFKGQLYADFRSALDTEMKRLKQAGIGSDKRQPEPLSPEEEELLWKKSILGDHSPQALLNSVFFFNGVCFALRGGDEHRQLRFKECQIQVVEKPGERAYFVYTEVSSKNYQVGLKVHKLKTKQNKWSTMKILLNFQVPSAAIQALQNSVPSSS